MQEQPVQIDRTQVLKDAEAALVAHRLYAQRRETARLKAVTVERLVEWQNAFPPQTTTETEVVVDAAIRSITTSRVLLTPAEGALAAEAVRTSAEWMRPEPELVARRALADRLEAR